MAYSQSLKINNIGMYILGLWAIANIGVGAYGWIKFKGESKYFHQMNLFWNIINLTIACFALYKNLHANYALMNAEDILNKQIKTENLYLINAGLDIGYIIAGILLLYFSRKPLKVTILLKGYGKSVILQGSFLIVFDIIMYGVLNLNRMNFPDHIGLNLCQQYVNFGFV